MLTMLIIVLTFFMMYDFQTLCTKTKSFAKSFYMENKNTK